MKRGKSLLILSGTLALLSACKPSDPLVANGQQIAKARGCVSCHSSDGAKSVGPTWIALYGSTVELDDGSKVVADDAYLKESMQDPSAKTVKGFPAGKMERSIPKGSLSENEVTALIAYIRSLG